MNYLVNHTADVETEVSVSGSSLQKLLRNKVVQL
jgi:hypothetical protein